ncbi:hypothetical protein DL897_16150 [Thermoflavimicrobium daqui]|uniref:Uncharacterized protein n=1 Tax=Thermoflavimicrobium daqui TaxID=2137476 RepID=A0A364K1C8_9BACL|nr:hypothetical protein DL897_16150 [Thermoflavimicrobium daqui]
MFLLLVPSISRVFNYFCNKVYYNKINQLLYFAKKRPLPYYAENNTSNQLLLIKYPFIYTKKTLSRRRLLESLIPQNIEFSIHRADALNQISLVINESKSCTIKITKIKGALICLLLLKHEV